MYLHDNGISRSTQQFLPKKKNCAWIKQIPSYTHVFILVLVTVPSITHAQLLARVLKLYA